MGKKQHQKDKLYLTTTEWRDVFGGCKDESILRAQQAKFKRLPFDCCCLSLQPFDFPVCSTDGHIFDITNIVPFAKKYGKNPVTGEKLDSASLVKLNFRKNNEGAYYCPTTFRVFTNTSHIVAIRPTGNVYSYEAVDELNFKTKNFRDLLTDEPFTRNDVITLQDPHNWEKFNISNFYHVRKKLKFSKDEESNVGVGSSSTIKTMNTETRDTLLQLEKDYKPKPEVSTSKPKADALNAAHFSTGMVAAGFTSTVMEPLTRQEAAIVDENKLKYSRTTKKGYVRLVTNFGPLNFELHCDLTPKAADNFIGHCKSGYYKQTKFHRSIKNFMIQGGDPTGSGTGGESIFGKPFEDEFDPRLSHEGRGILSMANRGKNTNTSQFFITFRSCKHLDRKHTVFGKLVGGFDTLTALERIQTDRSDKPQDEVVVLDTQVFVDPFEEAEELLKKERAEIRLQNEQAKKAESLPKKRPDVLKAYKSGVGKYANPDSLLSSKNQPEAEPVNKKLKVSAAPLGDFSSW